MPGPTITVRLELGDHGLRLEVSDNSARQPVPRHYRVEATTGRGLAQLDAVAGRWGVERHDGGKTVWAELTQGRPHPRGRPDLVVDLASYPDLDPGPGRSGPQSGPRVGPGPTLLRPAV